MVLKETRVLITILSRSKKPQLVKTVTEKFLLQSNAVSADRSCVKSCAKGITDAEGRSAYQACMSGVYLRRACHRRASQRHAPRVHLIDECLIGVHPRQNLNYPIHGWMGLFSAPGTTPRVLETVWQVSGFPPTKDNIVRGSL